MFRPALVVAGILLAAGNVLGLGRPAKFSDAAKTPLFELSSALLLVGACVLLITIIAMQVRHADQVGGFGLFAATVAIAGTMLFAGLGWSETFLDPAAAKVAPAFLDDQPPAVLVIGLYLSPALFAVGWILYAIATLRARVFARVPAVILLIGAILALAPMPVGRRHDGGLLAADTVGGGRGGGASNSPRQARGFLPGRVQHAEPPAQASICR